MKNSLTLKMYVILVITVLAVAVGVYFIVYTLSYGAMINDIRERADGVKDYILSSITAKDFEEIGKDSEGGALARLRVQETLSRLRGAGNLKHLYIAWENEDGEIATTMDAQRPEEGGNIYTPEGRLDQDLRQSLKEGVAVIGKEIYQTEYGSLYTIYWPVLSEKRETLGTVCMEFDVESIQQSYKRTAIYSLELSLALIILLSIIAYLTMNRAAEPFYKKMAYTDFLTGYENRMAFEQRLRECEPLAAKGRIVTLIVFDLNNLKTVNDTLGHKQGDIYLKNTADAIAQILGKEIPFYRIGGDEFASIVVDWNEKELEELMNALRSEKAQVLKDFPFNCASGAATFTAGVDGDLRDVFKRADEEMYAEKKRQKGTDG